MGTSQRRPTTKRWETQQKGGDVQRSRFVLQPKMMSKKSKLKGRRLEMEETQK
jgi:hypothetical protein